MTKHKFHDELSVAYGDSSSYEALERKLCGPLRDCIQEHEQVIADLGATVEMLRARLDASTRSTLWTEAVDADDELAIVRRKALDAAHGVARRNREDFELGDDF